MLTFIHLLGVEKKAINYGTALTGQPYKPSAKALPSTARKPAMKRSNSTPASTRPPTSGLPIGAKKYPGSNQVQGAVGGAKKTAGGVNKTISGVTGNASKVTGGVVGRANSTVGSLSSTAAKGPESIVGGGRKALGGATKSIPPFKGPASASSALNNNISKPAYPTEKKTAVKAWKPKPFTPPVEQKKPDPKKPYPGTNTLPGQSRTPVQQHKYKPLPRLGPQIGQGQTMQHISI
jgi:hypothetical protein